MKKLTVIAAAIAAFSSPAFAEIKAQSDTGFNVVHIATVDAQPDAIWRRLIVPKQYWSKSHSWSGSVDGFVLEPRAGGCFCEMIQEKDAKGKVKNIGSVEHMRVIFAQPDKVLRMQGALGPLQSEAVLGTLTVAINPAADGKGTNVSFSYVVGGYMRYKVSEIAPAVDKVIGEQFAGLIAPFTAIEVAAAPATDDKPKDWSLDLEGIEEDGAAAPKPEPRKAVSGKPAIKKAAPAKPKPPVTTKPKPKPKPAPAKPINDTSR
jgi:hypothetical protein